MWDQATEVDVCVCVCVRARACVVFVFSSHLFWQQSLCSRFKVGWLGSVGSVKCPLVSGCNPSCKGETWSTPLGAFRVLHFAVHLHNYVEPIGVIEEIKVDALTI